MKKRLAIIMVLFSLVLTVSYSKYLNMHAIKAIGWLWVLDSPYAFDDPDNVTNKVIGEINQTDIGPEQFGVN